MKSLYYTLDDAQRWAEFSGDYNPIHFNLEWVQARGGHQLSVHGMRALLDAKQFVSEQVVHKSLSISPYMKCAVRLRYPLWNDENYDLVSRNKVGSAAILSSVNQQNCLTCQLSPLESYDFNNMDTINYISSDEISALQLLFSNTSESTYEWQFIDAIMFRHLINDDSLLRQENIAEWLPQETTLKDIFSQYQVVQTHQEIIFESELLAKWNSAPEPIKISIQPSLVIGDIQSGLFVGIKTIASYRNKLISNSITLKINSKTD